MNKFIKVFGILFILAGVFLVLRFTLGGNEDTWICEEGEWVKHGNPSQPQPVIPCEKEGQSIEQIQPTGEFKKVSFEESQRIAQDFASNSSTYKFDGSNLVLDSSQALKCPYCWEFKFSFESSHAGYGDREGQVLAQAVTAHTLLISVNQGEISLAVVDGSYDEKNLKFIK